MPVRIYDIARKLEIPSKEVLVHAKDLGIENARVASSSLDKITAEYLEQEIEKKLGLNKPAPEPEEAPAAEEPKAEEPTVKIIREEEKPEEPAAGETAEASEAAEEPTAEAESDEAPAEPAATEEESPTPEPEPEPENHVEKTNRPALIYFYMTNMMLGMAYYGFTTFMPTHFAENTDQFLPFISNTMKAGVFPTMVFLAGIIGQLIGGKLGSMYHRPKMLMLIVAVNIPFLMLMGYSSDLILVVFSIFMGMAYFSNQPISNTLIAEFTHSANRGLGYGISFFLSFGIGSFAAGLGGYIAENMGVAAVFPIMGCILIPGYSRAKTTTNSSPSGSLTKSEKSTTILGPSSIVACCGIVSYCETGSFTGRTVMFAIISTISSLVLSVILTCDLPSHSWSAT